MKKENILLIALVSFLAAFSIIGCDDMNSVNQEWYDQGETVYTGIVDSIKLTPGYKRVSMEWEINSDPRVKEVVITWNDGEESVTVPVNRTSSGNFKMTYLLENLAEGTYTFVFTTNDGKGNYSVPQEESVVVYGDTYTGNLRIRSVSSIEKLASGNMKIYWQNASSSILYTVVTYTNTAGEIVTVIVDNDDTTTELEGLKTGDSVEIYSVYQPADSMDEMSSSSRSYTMPRLSREMDKSKFAIVVCAGDNNTANNSRNLARIWDGKTANPNILHTVSNASGFTWPHHFTWDIGVLCDLSKFHIWPRTDGSNSYYGHQPKAFELWVAAELKADLSDESYWKTDSWKDDWYKVIDVEVEKAVSNALATWQAGWEYDIEQLPERVRYFRLVAKSNWGGENCVNIGEVSIYGDDL